MLLSMATTAFAPEMAAPRRRAPCWDPVSDERTQVLLIDTSRAYFNAKTDENDPLYVDLPREVNAPPGMCALLKRHMFGTRRAAEGWQEEYWADFQYFPAKSCGPPMCALKGCSKLA